MMNEYDIWLSTIDISNKSLCDLICYYKDSKKIWELSEKELKFFGLSDKNIEKLLDENKKINLEKYIKYIYEKDINVILYNSNLYPDSLNTINDKPAFLYVRGNIENLYCDNIAIVGSRKATEYGKNISRKIAKDIADLNINVVSGLAVGIDKYAHLGALDSKIGKTIAVLGTGISDNEIYPYENKKIFERILECGGTIISEFKLGTKPEKYNFPRRNRIISGLSKKIIVVEATPKSGSLITVDYALEQGKDVYAIPGNLTSINSIGTNQLIAEGAYIYTGIQDIL